MCQFKNKPVGSFVCILKIMILKQMLVSLQFNFIGNEYFRDCGLSDLYLSWMLAVQAQLYIKYIWMHLNNYLKISKEIQK